MSRNIELKARVEHLAIFRARLELLGATGPEELRQTDTFFAVPSGRLKLREFGDQTGELIFYVRADTPGPKLSEYQRAPISNTAMVRDLLGRSLGIRATVRKTRTVFLLGHTRIHLDEVEGLGAFVELEVVLRDDQSDVDGERVAVSLLDALSIPAADLIAPAYVDLLLETQTS